MPADILQIPVRNQDRTNTRRKIEYRPNKVVLDQIQVDGQERQSFVKFSSARLIRCSGRRQFSSDNKPMLVVTMDIILDGLEVGLIDEKVGPQLHEILKKEGRYGQYTTLAHRVKAQQWMAIDDVSKIATLSTALRANGFRSDKQLKNPVDSLRTTQDLFLLRPVQQIDRDNPTNFGQKLDFFEVSVNPNYADGFSSFHSGLTEQMQRWEAVSQEQDEEIRSERVKKLADNVHYVGGVFRSADDDRFWPRTVDVGLLGFAGQTFPLYSVNGSEVTEDFLRTELVKGLGAETDRPVAAPNAAVEIPFEIEEAINAFGNA